MKQNKKSLARIKGMRLTIAELDLIDVRRTYRVLRNAYFKESNLPPVEQVMILFLKDSVMELVTQGERGCHGCYAGEGNLITGAIYLRNADDESISHETLVHEMAHMAVDIKWQRSMGHGKHWKAEMRRLANLGAFDNTR